MPSFVVGDGDTCVGFWFPLSSRRTRHVSVVMATFSIPQNINLCVGASR